MIALWRPRSVPSYAKQQHRRDHLLQEASEVFSDALPMGCREDLIAPYKGDQAINLCAYPYRPILLRANGGAGAMFRALIG